MKFLKVRYPSNLSVQGVIVVRDELYTKVVSPDAVQLTENDEFILVDTYKEYILPDATLEPNMEIVFKCKENTCDVTTLKNQLIDEFVGVTLNAWEAWKLKSDGTNWLIIT